MNIEILQKLCAGNYGPNCTAPWSEGEFTRATSGHLLIQVPRMADVEENPKAPDVSKVFPHGEPMAWYAIPACEEKPPVDCEKCGGKVGQPATCPECDGDGEVELSNAYNDYICDCLSCDGTGKTPVCSKCDGTGKIEVFSAQRIGPAKFQVKYLKLLAELPNCNIGPMNDTGPAWFRFDGGTGLIMPCRPDADSL